MAFRKLLMIKKKKISNNKYLFIFSGYSTSNHSSPSTILVGISYNYCSSNDMFLLNSWEAHSGNPSDKNPFHLLLDYYRANEMKFSQVCFQGPTFSVLIPLVQKLRISLVKVSDNYFSAISQPWNSGKFTKSHEIHKNMQNPTKFASNLIKYLLIQHIWNLSWLSGMFKCH